MNILQKNCVACALICILSVTAAPARSTEKTTVCLQWTPQAQFAGFYAARDKGIYKKYGLNVTIIHAGPKCPVVKTIASGEATFITSFLTSAIKFRADGLKVVDIAQMSRKSALMFVAKKSRGIKNPLDLEGKKIGLWFAGFQETPKALLKKYAPKAKIVEVFTGIELLMYDGIDALTVMRYNEYHTLLNHGIDPEELTVMNFADFGFNIPEDGIYCLEKTLKDNPELCRKFVQATFDGWRYAFKNKDEMLEIIAARMRQANVPFNKAHQIWMLKEMENLIFPESKDSVRLPETTYLKAANILKSDGIIKTIPPYKQFYQPVLKNVQK